MIWIVTKRNNGVSFQIFSISFWNIKPIEHFIQFFVIFFNNCFKNGLLPIRLSEMEIARLFDEVLGFNGYELTIDLPAQLVRTGDGRAFEFEIDPFRKDCLINGLDDIGLTLKHADKIRTYEGERLARHPWLDVQPVGVR